MDSLRQPSPAQKLALRGSVLVLLAVVLTALVVLKRRAAPEWVPRPGEAWEDPNGVLPEVALPQTMMWLTWGGAKDERGAPQVAKMQVSFPRERRDEVLGATRRSLLEQGFEAAATGDDSTLRGPWAAGELVVEVDCDDECWLRMEWQRDR